MKEDLSNEGYFLKNFSVMLAFCLFVDLITWVTRHEADVVSSFIIAAVIAAIFTIFRIFRK
jgi:hypothetical protein